jgi:tRNA threonylcarbamoyladenosine biosynthesis protein TsaB
MTVLGIETSTAVCSVGLTDGSGWKPEKSLMESHIHAEKLLTLIHELCDEQKVKLSQLDGVGVSVGPGSFTGLRIGFSTAKGLCFALEKPLIAVPTFVSIATSAAESHPDCARIIVCIDAKQREYYIGVYEQNNGTVSEIQPVHIGTLASAHAAVSLRTLIVTDRTADVKTESGDSITVEEVFPHCRGDVIARLALQRWTPEETTDWAQREPMYLKDFVIRTQTKLK